MSNRPTVAQLRARKNGDPIVVLTAYTTPMARLLDPHVDILLVGDSLGMVLYGMDSTRSVTLDMMLAHGAAVMRGSSKAFVVIDLPFGTYETSKEQAYQTASRVLKETGAQAVKLEGGSDMAQTIAHLTAQNIPVMAHIGLKPQSAENYRWQGRTDEDRKTIMQDALAIEKAGAFSVVIEATEESLSREITQTLKIPTIGIGASPACDGQVIVTEDMLGLGDWAPKFVKRYADLKTVITEAASNYAREVRGRKFPTAEHIFTTTKK